jgi:hypothetical protein
MKTENELEIEYIDELIRLKKENPGARIIPMVATEEMSSDWYMTAAKMGRPRLATFTLWHGDEITDDEEYVKDEIACGLFDDGVVGKEWSDENVEIEVMKEFNKLKWETAIFIDITG